MKISDMFGWMAFLTSFGIILVGMPSQIISNFRRKSCVGVSRALVITMIAAYGCWSGYGYTKPDPYLLYSQSIGFFLATALGIQMWVYRKNTARAQA